MFRIFFVIVVKLVDLEEYVLVKKINVFIGKFWWNK